MSEWDELVRAWRTGGIRSKRLATLIRLEKASAKVQVCFGLGILLEILCFCVAGTFAPEEGMQRYFLVAVAILFAALILIALWKTDWRVWHVIAKAQNSLTPAERVELRLRHIGIRSLPAQEHSDIPPWEGPAADRRDCLPHRGDVLRLLAILSLLCAGATLCLPLQSRFIDQMLGALPAIVRRVGLLTPGVVGLGLGFSVWRLAWRDLADMRVGRRDASGLQMAYRAWQMAVLGACLNWLLLIFLVALMLLRR